MTHWLAHILGIDTQHSYWYDFWSGVGTQVKLDRVALVAVVYHRFSCAERRCWRIGRFHDGTQHRCRRHHQAKGVGR